MTHNTFQFLLIMPFLQALYLLCYSKYFTDTNITRHYQSLTCPIHVTYTHQYLFYDQLQLIGCNNNNHFHIFIKMEWKMRLNNIRCYRCVIAITCNINTLIKKRMAMLRIRITKNTDMFHREKKKRIVPNMCIYEQYIYMQNKISLFPMNIYSSIYGELGFLFLEIRANI